MTSNNKPNLKKIQQNSKIVKILEERLEENACSHNPAEYLLSLVARGGDLYARLCNTKNPDMPSVTVQIGEEPDKVIYAARINIDQKYANSISVRLGEINGGLPLKGQERKVEYICHMVFEPTDDIYSSKGTMLEGRVIRKEEPDRDVYQTFLSKILGLEEIGQRKTTKKSTGQEEIIRVYLMKHMKHSPKWLDVTFEILGEYPYRLPG